MQRPAGLSIDVGNVTKVTVLRRELARAQQRLRTLEDTMAAQHEGVPPPTVTPQMIERLVRWADLSSQVSQIERELHTTQREIQPSLDFM